MNPGRNSFDDLKHILTTTQLPALPRSAIRLLELSQNPDNGPAEFAVPIDADPGLTGQVLRFVNSSYFGFAREISTVKLAINLVGIRAIKNFALWSAVFSLLPNPRCGPLDLKSLWQDSLRRGVTARMLGKLWGLKNAEEPFSAALLQDMAIPILAKESTDVYARLIAARDNGRIRLSSLESQVFGWTHGDAAGIMARHWNLPEGFAVLIESHSSIESLAAEAGPASARLAVALSALLPAGVDGRWEEAAQFEGYYQQFRPNDGPDLPELLACIDAEYAEFAPVLKLSIPAKTLVACYQETLAAAG